MGATGITRHMTSDLETSHDIPKVLQPSELCKGPRGIDDVQSPLRHYGSLEAFVSSKGVVQDDISGANQGPNVPEWGDFVREHQYRTFGYG